MKELGRSFLKVSAVFFFPALAISEGVLALAVKSLKDNTLFCITTQFINIFTKDNSLLAIQGGDNIYSLHTKKE